MSFITGLMLIDAPAAALNNAGKPDRAEFNNEVATKVIKTQKGSYPYVSAQAYRYWLRDVLAKYVPTWQMSPTYKESENLAYTAADPIAYWDDDLMGYMRAPSKQTAKERAKDEAYNKLPPLDTEKKDGKDIEQALTRVSPFRVSTLVSIAPVNITQHQEGMFRHEGDPVLYSTQFYRTTLKGMFSLDLNACGTFTDIDRTGFRNLSKWLKDQAAQQGLEYVASLKAYRLPLEQRLERVAALLEGMARLEGGAKQALHYTDVAPTIVFLAVTKGGNNLFGHVTGAKEGLPELKVDALNDSLRVFTDDLVSKVYIGWVKGYADAERAKVEQLAQDDSRIHLAHPREALRALAADLQQHHEWLG